MRTHAGRPSGSAILHERPRCSPVLCRVGFRHRGLACGRAALGAARAQRGGNLQFERGGGNGAERQHGEECFHLAPLPSFKASIKRPAGPSTILLTTFAIRRGPYLDRRTATGQSPGDTGSVNDRGGARVTRTNPPSFANRLVAVRASRLPSKRICRVPVFADRQRAGSAFRRFGGNSPPAATPPPLLGPAESNNRNVAESQAHRDYGAPPPPPPCRAPTRSGRAFPSR
jgi:hypothetical protein